MDYEKKYNDALKRAKSAIIVAADKDLVKGVASTIFPELAESEDERIRKWIYNMVENLGYPADEAAEKELEEMQPLALAYLDKQKPAGWSEEDKDKLYRIIETLLADKAAARQENPKHYDVLCEAYDELISWLKSLRPPQYCENCRLKKSVQGWKPSEEQIDKLFSIVAALRKDYCDDMADFLANLYAELKKLGVKEEPEYYQHFDPDC